MLLRKYFLWGHKWDLLPNKYCLFIPPCCTTSAHPVLKDQCLCGSNVWNDHSICTDKKKEEFRYIHIYVLLQCSHRQRQRKRWNSGWMDRNMHYPQSAEFLAASARYFTFFLPSLSFLDTTSREWEDMHFADITEQYRQFTWGLLCLVACGCCALFRHKMNVIYDIVHNCTRQIFHWYNDSWKIGSHRFESGESGAISLLLSDAVFLFIYMYKYKHWRCYHLPILYTLTYIYYTVPGVDRFLTHRQRRLDGGKPDMLSAL